MRIFGRDAAICALALCGSGEAETTPYHSNHLLDPFRADLPDDHHRAALQSRAA